MIKIKNVLDLIIYIHRYIIILKNFAFLLLKIHEKEEKHNLLYLMINEIH